MLGIVVVTYGSADLLSRNLVATGPTAGPSVVVVVDNFRTQADRHQVRTIAREHGWDLVTNPHNRGFGAAANQGVARAVELGCDAVVLVNPDLAVAADVLDELARSVRHDPNVLVTPRILRTDGTPWFTGGVLDTRRGRTRNAVLDDRPRSAGWLTGACLAASTELWERLGGLSEDYHLYWEDVDLSFRATRAGARLVVRPDLEVVHEVGGTQGVGKSAVYMFHNCRNRLLFGARHMGRRALAGWVLATPAESWRVLRRGGRRALVRDPRLLLAGVRGTFAGLAVAIGALATGEPPTLGRRKPGSRPRVVVAHPSADRYGSDRMVVESVAGLVEAGWDVVFTVPGEGSLVRDVQNAGAHVVQVPLPVLSKAQLGPRALPAFAAASLPAVVRAWRMLGRAAPAAVYVSTVTIPWWAVAGRLRGIPVVTHVHEAERSAHRALRMLLAAPLLLSRTVVANSRFALTTALEALPRLRDRSRIVPNGVVGPAEITATRPDLGEGVRMVYVGRLSPRKGVDVAVRATATLARRGVDARLDVVGAVFPGYEWYREELEALVVELDLGDRVVLHGFQEPMWPFLERADLALVPSRTDEPFGNTAVEAVLAGRPVVVTASGGLVEAVAGYRSARIVPPGDAEGLADGVQDLLADWSAARSQAVEDAAVAADRHAPGAYRARIAGAVAEVAR